MLYACCVYIICYNHKLHVNVIHVYVVCIHKLHVYDMYVYVVVYVIAMKHECIITDPHVILSLTLTLSLSPGRSGHSIKTVILAQC